LTQFRFGFGFFFQKNKKSVCLLFLIKTEPNRKWSPLLSWLEIEIYNFFICFIYNYLSLLTRVWQAGWLEFIFLSFFLQCNPLTLSWLRIKHYIFFYKVITVLWLESRVRLANSRFFSVIFNWILFNFIILLVFVTCRSWVWPVDSSGFLYFFLNYYFYFIL
jgi:hypothetical protein